MIGWNFPSNNHGKEDGLNDPGIETFRDDPLLALAREINQNSCDAADRSTKRPVEVHFELIDVPMSKFPEHDKFKKILAACDKYWKHNAMARKFFKTASARMQEKKLSILKISDYNTTGLSGANAGHQSDWFKLTKSVGASDKQGGAGGSFGIGKHAPFACSDIRTVFYGTKDKEGNVAFQGVARLVTHARRGGDTTQGTGYYGESARNEPITKLAQIDKVFRRKHTGTDIFVAAFHPFDNWADQIIKSVLDSFFLAIHDGKLIVKVGDLVLNQTSIADHIRRFGAKDSDYLAHAYYQALTSEEAVPFSIEDFEGLGRVELRILPGKDFPKRIAMVRSTGMKIYDKGHFTTPMRFAGVFLAKGDKMNELLRSIEPPAHNAWQPERGDTQAKNVLRKLNGWINDCVRELTAVSEAEELDAEGLSQYLPDDADDTAGPNDSAAEGEKGEPLPDVDVQIKITEYNADAAKTRGVPQGGGAEHAAREVEGEEYSNDSDGGTADVGLSSGGEDEGSSTKEDEEEIAVAVGSRSVGLKNLRVYCADASTGKYRLMYEPETDGDGYLFVQVIGEVGEEAAPIKEARIPGGREGTVPAQKGKVGPLTFEKGKRASVDIVLDGLTHCALGVSAYAN